MAPTGEELEKQAAEKTKSLETETVHRIRITLTSRDVKALETVCANLKRGAVDKKLGVSRTMGRLFSRAASTAQAAAAEAAAAQAGGGDRRPPPPQQQQPAWAPDSQSDWGHPGAAGPGAGQW